MHVVYYYLINHYFSPLALLRTVWSINVLFGITGTIVLIVHSSYAIRIYYVSGRKLPIPIFMFFISLGNFALGWVLMAELFMHPVTTGSISGTPDTLAKAILISGAVIDWIIAITLGYYLNTARTGIKQTDKLIDSLIVYTINNGLVTSIADIIAMILVFTRPNDLYSLAISQVIGKLYSNTLMATFNSRKSYKASAPATLEIASNPISGFAVASNPGAIGISSTDSSSTNHTPVNKPNIA